ncbi:unnamed protein product [Caenorhabditis sp. 36 PRJEB53466]|nr:unnamed protein product [Caenorhabditis sp. 36 PRJEB53466]
MRFLILSAVAIIVIGAAVVPKSVHSEPHRLDKKDSIEREISEALKEIETSRDILKVTMTMNETDSMDERSPDGFLRGIEDVFSGMFTALQNSHVPFFGEQQESRSVGPAANMTADQATQDLLTRTRTELKEDIDSLRSYLDSVRMEFDEWMISNRHQEFKSMMIGGLSAVFVLFVYYILCKSCRRRSRMNHLSAFANEGFGSRHGDTEGLLPTTSKKGHRFPSNSDEDI